MEVLTLRWSLSLHDDTFNLIEFDLLRPTTKKEEFGIVVDPYRAIFRAKYVFLSDGDDEIPNLP